MSPILKGFAYSALIGVVICYAISAEDGTIPAWFSTIWSALTVWCGMELIEEK